jgi:hypothetical protein
MTDFNIRRRLIDEGRTSEEIEALFDDVAEQRGDEYRDLQAEEHYREEA